MLLILSPAKTMKPVSEGITGTFTEPDFIREANYLNTLLRSLNPGQLSSLMQTSPKLTASTIAMLSGWKDKLSEDEGYQAILTYSGEVYNGLQARQLDERSLQYAQKHVRILSAVYGILRPLDRIQFYRLEMQARLANSNGDSLYDFWSGKIPDKLEQAVKESGDNVLINLASREYYTACGAEGSPMRVITPKFLEQDGNTFRMVTIYAKKARGMMTRFAIENRIKKAEHLKLFDSGGYLFNPDMSDDKEWAFVR